MVGDTSSLDLSGVRIVLVEPLYGGNVGAVCRAMANMGLSDLAIAGEVRLDLDEARKMACHAVDVLDSRTHFETLAGAVADCGLVMGTSARSGLYRQHARTPREWAREALDAAADRRTALVFGREDNGLSNEELAYCTQIIQIPTCGEYTSINLAQSVMICCYELFLAAGTYTAPQEKSDVAPSHLRERMFDMWRETLLEIGFMQGDKADHMMLGLRRIFSRGTLTDDDVRILMGICRQTQWAARRAGAPDDTRGGVSTAERV